MDFIVIIAQELNIKPSQVEKTINLLDEGNTIPFIARYRKEVTGNLNEEELRHIEERIAYLRNLQERKEQIIKSIEEQGKMTEELKGKIVKATKLQELEDLYLPYKQKKNTRASIAKEKGLTPVADLIGDENKKKEDIDREALKYINPEKQVNTVEDVINGAKDIVAERISEHIKVRNFVRDTVAKEGRVTSTASDKEAKTNYEIYYNYNESFSSMPPHRILAINRGNREKHLKVSIEIDEEKILQRLKNVFGYNGDAEYFIQALQDGFKRLLWPSIEREMRKQKTEEAEKQAIEVFSKNLKSLLLLPPVKGHRVLGIDPGFRTGCKIAAVDETGKLLGTATIYPHPPQSKKEEAKKIVAEFIKVNNIKFIAVGNGTACRETEAFLAETMDLFPPGTAFTIVSEAGASVYSASPLAKDEFPDMDVSIRGAVSIARRLQDPLAELVKIEPKAIGVGMYQHDVDQKELTRVLGNVVESVVNEVGVNLNTASPSLLEYVSGMNSKLAKNIVLYRQKKGEFKNREELLEVSGLGEKTFTQCSGFMRILDGDNPLDSTPVHPESYRAVKALFHKLGLDILDLKTKSKWKDIRSSIEKLSVKELIKELNIGELTLQDILEALKKPGRDVREDIPKPIFRTDILTMEQLKPGMTMKGTVRNVIDFGAFVDLGVKRDGLIHISQMGERYIKHPLEVLSVGQVVEVKVLDVDIDRGRISLSLL